MWPPLASVMPSATAMATLVFSLLVIAVAAFAGGASVVVFRLGHRPMQVVVSLTGGVLLGVGVLHLLPHAWMQLGRDIDATMGWALGGFFLMFLLERAFHGHAHHTTDGECVHVCDHDHTHDGDHGHDHGDQHGADDASDHAHEHDDHEHCCGGGSRWAWCGAFAGLALHSLADGAALAASIRADSAHGMGWWAGSATFLAILLHKPLDAGIIAALMLDSDTSPRLRTIVNIAYALVVPIGAVAFLASLPLAGGRQDAVIGIAMAIAAGAFICIAAADLLPEVEFHSHDRVLLTTALSLGLALAWGITAMERASHAHAAQQPASMSAP